MNKFILVGMGGFLGSIGRYALTLLMQSVAPRAAFPLGTLLVNVVGCGVIGVLAAIGDVRHALSPEARAFLMAGVLGGFTTFSSFAYETLMLGRDGAALKAGANVVLHFAGCLFAVWLGYVIARSILSSGL